MMILWIGYIGMSSLIGKAGECTMLPIGSHGNFNPDINLFPFRGDP